MRILRKLFGSNVPDRSRLMRQAKTKYRSGKLEQAIEISSRVIAANRQNAAAYFLRGMACARLGELAKAKGDFKQVLEHATDAFLRRDAYYNLGLASEKSGKDERAVEWYRKALDVDPNLHKALCNIGGALQRMASQALKAKAAEKNLRQALQYLNQALAIESRDAVSLWNRAIVHGQLGNTIKAHEDLSAFSRVTPPDDPLRRVAEDVLRDRKDFSALLERERRREFERLVERIIDSNNKGAFEEAFRLCDIAMSIDLADAAQLRSDTVWDEKAHALLGLERAEEAFECCEQGIRVNPASARLHHSKATILDLWGRRREALSTFRKYVELAPREYAPVIKSVKRRIQQLEQESADLTFPNHYEQTAQKASGDTCALSLVHTATEDMLVTLVYQWAGDLSPEQADNLDTRARAYVACAIYDAATMVGLSCEPGPLHGIRPSWHLNGERMPVSLVSAGFDVSDKTCFMIVGPVMVMHEHQRPSAYQSEELVSGFQVGFSEIEV